MPDQIEPDQIEKDSSNLNLAITAGGAATTLIGLGVIGAVGTGTAATLATASVGLSSTAAVAGAPVIIPATLVITGGVIATAATVGTTYFTCKLGIKFFKKLTREPISKQEMRDMIKLFDEVRDGTTKDQKLEILSIIIREYTNAKRNSSDQSINLMAQLLSRSTIEDKFNAIEDYLCCNKGRQYRCNGKKLHSIIHATLIVARTQFMVGQEYNKYILDFFDLDRNNQYEFSNNGEVRVFDPPPVLIPM